MNTLKTFTFAAILNLGFISGSAYSALPIDALERDCILGNDGSACSDAALLYIEGRKVALNDDRASELFYHGCELGDDFSCSALAFSLEPTTKENASYVNAGKSTGVKYIPFSTFARSVKACILTVDSNGSPKEAFRVRGILFSSSDLPKYNSQRRITDDSDYYTAKFADGAKVTLKFDDTGKYLPVDFIDAVDKKRNAYRIRYGWKNCTNDLVK